MPAVLADLSIGCMTLNNTKNSTTFSVNLEKQTFGFSVLESIDEYVDPQGLE
jgi:hypothetical protein